MKRLNKKLPEIVLQKKEKIEELCRNYNIRLLGLFGSFVRGDYTEDSDIDILVKFGDTKSLLQLVHLENVMTDLLGRKTEIVELEAIQEKLKKYVTNEAVIVYEKR